MAAAPDRYHALDSLRAFAMFLGIALHAGLSFLEQPPAFWPVRDDRPIPLSDVLLYAVHDFRMQLFFLLAGFFGCLLRQRYGAAGMVRHRLKRVALPFVLGVVFIAPTVLAALLYAEVGNVRSESVRGEPSPARPFAASLVADHPEASDAGVVCGFFLSGAFVAGVRPFHLWFLYFLLYFYVGALLLDRPLRWFAGTRAAAACDSAFRRVVGGWLRVPVLTLLTVPLLLPMRSWAVDTPAGWEPELRLLAYYGGFFAVGWALYRHRDLVPAFGRHWAAYLVVANVVMMPAMATLVIVGTGAERAGGDVTALWVGACAAMAAYTWLMVCGLWGGFLRWFARETAWSRYLADASYWCYLASITPIVLLQFWVRDWQLPGLVKFTLLTAVTTAGLLASYEWGVRYTLIGAILNGRKHRSQRPPGAEAA